MIVRFSDLPQYSGHILVDGGFDPIHGGHIAYLQAARTFGPLLCAVASDDQIREKGREPLLPQASRVAVLVGLCDAVYAKDRPTEDVIRQLRPRVYVKGMDWEGKLPEAQLNACAAVGTEIGYVDAGSVDSSTARLRAWALADADRSLDRLADVMAAQVETPSARYDKTYFVGDWRGDGNAYTFETRREIEGRHPDILAEVFRGLSVLDVGCGPGYLVRLLKERGMDAGGCDTSADAVQLAATHTVIRIAPAHVPPGTADVVISREVMEHCTVGQVVEMVADLFRIARRFVYITTRFHAGPIFDVMDEREVDPTHQTLLTQPLLRALCVLNGGRRRRDLETALDWQQKGRVLVYEV